MGGGRFGPVMPDREPKKKYKVDYNRLITVVMIVATLVLAIIIIIDARRADEPSELLVVGSMPPSPLTPQVVTSPTVSPEELRPTAEPGRVPLFRRANTDEKRIAITLDEFPSAANIQNLLKLLNNYGARVTFFPTGKELSVSAGIWPQVVLAGHEIENHSYQNADLTNMSIEEIAVEIGAQTELLRSLTVESYSPHFLRPENLLNIDIQPLNDYLISQGYYGIVSWAVDTPASFDEIEPGQVLRYRLNDAGLKSLSQAVPVLVENGYELVTLNQLFMYPENIESSAEE